MYDWATTLSGAEQYKFQNAGQAGSSGSGDEMPVTMVSWRDCIVWCNAYTQMKNGNTDECVYRKSDGTVLKSSKNAAAADVDAAVCNLDKKGYRLPTEAEWEYAARKQDIGTNAQKYGSVWLTNLNSASGAKANNAGETGRVAVYSDNSNDKTAQVGSKAPNASGLYDMSGNVWEWCFDWHDNDERAGDGGQNPVPNPIGVDSGSDRVVRGGSWQNDKSETSVGYRNAEGPESNNNVLGFRLACSAP